MKIKNNNSRTKFSIVNFSLISFLVLFAVILVVPTSVRSAAIVKGEIPVVEPLQSLPTTVKPNYNNSVQSGEFESKQVEEVEPATVEQAPLAAPTVKSGNGYILVFSFIVVLILSVGIYFLWKKIKLKL